MTGVQLAQIITAIGSFYGILIIVYVLMSWLPDNGIVYDVKRVLGSVVEPYLSIFRRFIPPLGALDLSPLIAYFVWQLLVRLIAQAVARI